MKRFLILLLFILLLTSCTQPDEPTTIDPQHYFSVYNSVASGNVWVRLIEQESEYHQVPGNQQKRWAVDSDGSYHISFRIVEDITAVEDGDYMAKVEKISEARDMEVLIDHRLISISVFKDGENYVYSLRYFD